MNQLQYRPRKALSYPAIAVSGRELKVYGVFSDPAKVARMPAASDLAACIADLCPPAADARDHGLGFAILHLAEDGDYLLISHWIDANMLKHQVYQCVVTEQGPTGCSSLAPSGIIACVWELEIMKFERDAWVRTVLSAGVLDETSRRAYLDATYTGWV